MPVNISNNNTFFWIAVHNSFRHSKFGYEVGKSRTPIRSIILLLRSCSSSFARCVVMFNLFQWHLFVSISYFASSKYLIRLPVDSNNIDFIKYIYCFFFFFWNSSLPTHSHSTLWRCIKILNTYAARGSYLDFERIVTSAIHYYTISDEILSTWCTWKTIIMCIYYIHIVYWYIK